jgi:hypothetical protein
VPQRQPAEAPAPRCSRVLIYLTRLHAPEGERLFVDVAQRVVAAPVAVPLAGGAAWRTTPFRRRQEGPGGSALPWHTPEATACRKARSSSLWRQALGQFVRCSMGRGVAVEGAADHREIDHIVSNGHVVRGGTVLPHHIESLARWV